MLRAVFFSLVATWASIEPRFLVRSITPLASTIAATPETWAAAIEVPT